MSGSLESLLKYTRASAGDACNDHDAIARVRPVDVYAVAKEIDRLRGDLKTALEAASAGVGWWVWQGDGEDHVESLTCPVLIRAEQMREIQAEIERLQAIVAAQKELLKLERAVEIAERKEPC